MNVSSSHIPLFHTDPNLAVQLDHVHAGVSLRNSKQGSEVGAAGCQDRAVGLEMSAPHHDDTIPQLTMDTLIVELLKDLLKVAWEIHGPKGQTRDLSRLKGVWGGYL